jgi:hypothetical protein
VRAAVEKYGITDIAVGGGVLHASSVQNWTPIR